jgi:hypothetical protein
LGANLGASATDDLPGHGADSRSSIALPGLPSRFCFVLGNCYFVFRLPGPVSGLPAWLIPHPLDAGASRRRAAPCDAPRLGRHVRFPKCPAAAPWPLAVTRPVTGRRSSRPRHQTRETIVTSLPVDAIIDQAAEVIEGSRAVVAGTSDTIEHAAWPHSTVGSGSLAAT